MYPLNQRDFYETLKSTIIQDADKIKKIDEIVALAQKKQEGNKDLFDSTAFEEAAAEQGVDLSKYTNAKNINSNRDFIGLIKKKASSSIRLGIDLNGGVEFLLELVPKADDEEAAKTDDEKAEKSNTINNFDRQRDIAIEILRKRLEAQKIYETEISAVGDKYVSLKVPLVSKDEKQKLLNLIKMTAKLDFRLIAENNARWVNEYRANPKGFKTPPGYQRMTLTEMDSNKKPKKEIVFVQIRPQMTGKNIEDAFPTTDNFGRRKISLVFNHAGAVKFGKVTSKNVGRRLGIVLDGNLYSAPSIREAIEGGRAEISGDFSREEANTISNALVSGNLPFKINVGAVFDIDPTLGAAAVNNGIWAGIIGLIAVALFMLLYYLRAGLVANIALVVNIVLVLGFLAAFESTLTLPGIAGIILTIGMAVDANVLIYERIREELKKNKALFNAIDTGYSRAFVTILDANLTTLFTALILMKFGSGAVKGFGVTLSVGIATSMFTALFLTRLVFDIMGRILPSRNLKMCQVFSETSINFLKMRFGAMTISGILIALTLVLVSVKGGDSLGVDFTGGTQIMLDYQKKYPEAQIAKVLDNAGFKDPKVTYKTSFSQEDNKKLEILIRDKNIPKDLAGESPKIKIEQLLNGAFKEAKFTGGQETSLGGLIGWEFSKDAMIAMGLAIIGIVIYISIRFEFAFAIASIIALIHDVLISTGIFLLCGRELSLPVIAALLTIIGYSLNDTIVVFDRIRENLEFIRGKGYKEIINLSINQTLSRTMLTSITTLLVLLILFFMGGIAVNDFVLVMLVGVVVGTYSSIFIASPIVAVWHKRIGSNVKDDLPAVGEKKEIAS
jgi:SecD/SecF fusion protein